MSAPATRLSALVSILIAAFVLRCGTGIVLQHLLDHKLNRFCLISGDAEGYWHLGKELARGADYKIYDPPRYVERMPGFPLLLAGCIKLFGENMYAIRIVLAAVGTLVCGLVYWLGRELFDHQTALVAAALAAISPALTGFSILILSEMLFTAGILGSLISLAKLAKTDFTHAGRLRGLWLAAAAGGWCAFATYVRPSWLLFAPGFVLVYFLLAADRKSALVRGVVLLASLGALLAPWTYRNYVVTGHFVPTTLWLGASLYDSLNQRANGDSDMAFVEADGIFRSQSEYAADRFYRDAAWEFVKSNPRRGLELAGIKLLRFWKPWPNAEQFNGLLPRAVIATFFFPAVVLALLQLGLWMRAGRRCLRQHAWGIFLALGPLAYFTALHMIFVGSLRYRLPAAASALVISAAGAVSVWKFRQARDAKDEG